jgi:hypothetical protein
VGWPAETLKTFLTEFGIAPALLLLILRRKGFVLLRRLPPWILFACFYGVLTVVTAPLIGTWPSRYLLYAWPLFWVVLPALLQAAGYKPRPILLVLYALVAWLPVLLDKALSQSLLSTVLTCGLALAVYGLLWKSTALLGQPAEVRLPAVGVR